VTKAMEGKTAMRLAHQGEIAAFLAAMSDDEVEVLLEICRRVDGGRKSYGPLRLREDVRDFPKEALNESLDQTFYLAGEVVKRRHLR
jgi:hypothetical protein